jgi:tetratricopeptide (TPR) repeat protein
LKFGELRLAQKRANDAETSFQQALSRDPNSLEALEGLITVAQLRNKPEDALKLIQNRISKDPNNANLYLLQGELLLQGKQVEQAEASFNRVVEIDNRNAHALTRLGEFQLGRSQYDQASSYFQRALQVAPNDAGLQVALGTVYEKQGNWQKAEDTYQKALSVQPSNAPAANNLAYLLLQHGGSVNLALTLAQTGRRGLPNMPNSADTLGWAYYNNGAYSVAAPLFEEAVKQIPGNQTYRYHLGLTYQKLNDAKRAKSELEQAIALDPKSSVAEQARQALGNSSGG